MKVPPIRILVVEDSSHMRRMVRNSLQQLGFEKPDEADDGRQALKHLKQNAYGLVLMDWNMPVMSGIEVLRFMRADHALKDVPVIMLTAEADKRNVLEAIGAGVTDYILKPFNVETLKAKIEPLLKTGA